MKPSSSPNGYVCIAAVTQWQANTRHMKSVEWVIIQLSSENSLIVTET